jgi:hypothetical protein
MPATFLPSTASFVAQADLGDGRWVADAAAMTRPAGHQHWVRPQSYAPVLAATYWHAAIADPNVSGVVILLLWSQLEPNIGEWNQAYLDEQAARCLLLGKKFRIRVMRQTWDDTNPTAPSPGKKVCPADMEANQAKFGQLIKQYDNGSHIGWISDITNAETRARFKAMLQRLAISIGSHPMFDGFALDESNWTLNGPNPPTGPQVIAATRALKEVYLAMASAFGPERCYPMVNHIGNASRDDMRALQNWCNDLGMRVALSDVYLPKGILPTAAETAMMGPFTMGPYRDTPYGRPTMIHVDDMTQGPADTHLAARVELAAKVSYALGATETVWAVINGAASAHWTTVKAFLATGG